MYTIIENNKIIEALYELGVIPIKNGIKELNIHLYTDKPPIVNIEYNPIEKDSHGNKSY
jgi:predicted transcriptional regulator YheO